MTRHMFANCRERQEATGLRRARKTGQLGRCLRITRDSRSGEKSSPEDRRTAQELKNRGGLPCDEVSRFRKITDLSLRHVALEPALRSGRIQEDILTAHDRHERHSQSLQGFVAKDRKFYDTRTEVFMDQREEFHEVARRGRCHCGSTAKHRLPRSSRAPGPTQS